MLAGFAYVATVSIASTPVHVDPATMAPSLAFAAEDSIVTGSIGDLFHTAMFVGPNRSEKQNRAIPEDDVIQVAANFAPAREYLLAQRPKQPNPTAIGLRDFLKIKSGDVEEAPDMALASVDPSLISAALQAIENATPKSPFPIAMTETLAYARADVPATVFDTPTSMRVSEKQFNCLATAVYFEARGESYRGQAAVAQVVLNRVKHKLYPNTICGVVFQNQHKRNACQFSFACDGIPERVTEKGPWDQAEEVARKVLDGEIYLTEVANATHYHANYVRPHWAPRMTKMTKIGLHIFYRFRNA